MILAADGPGFLVNRCGRPFGAEALRLLQERVATHEQIDRICRLGGGFRMGPFELMDLVGMDVGFEVAKSFTELSFGEPRWKPSPIQARMVAAGRLGRKAARGYYEYPSDGPYRPADPEPLEPGGGDGRILAISGRRRAGRGPARPRVEAGRLRASSRAGGPRAVHRRSRRRRPPWSAGARVRLCATRAWPRRGEQGAVGFHLLPPLDGVRSSSSPGTSEPGR